MKLEKDIHTTKPRESRMGKLGENALGPRIPVGQLWAGHSPGFIAAGLVGKNTLALFIWPTIKDHSSILHIHNHSMWPCAKTYRISRDHSRIILSKQNHPKFPFQNFFSSLSDWIHQSDWNPPCFDSTKIPWPKALGWPMELCNLSPAVSESCFSRFNLCGSLGDLFFSASQAIQKYVLQP